MTRRLLAEALGTAFLLAAVVGSGIMGERLAGGSVALALLANALATGCALYAIILVVGPLSGAHLNPAVSLAAALDGDLRWHALPGYVAAQILGAALGVIAAQAMFDLPLVEWSTRVRSGTHLWWAEAVATFGLLAVVLRVGRSRPEAVAAAVAAYITAAYWFTASTSFANPAVTLARTLTDSFAGIRPQDAPAYIAVQLLVVPLAVGLCGRAAAVSAAPLADGAEDGKSLIDSRKRTV